MTDTAKKALVILIIAFAIYYLVTEPINAANAVRSVINFLITVFNAIASFFRALAR